MVHLIILSFPMFVARKVFQLFLPMFIISYTDIRNVVIFLK